MTSQHINLNSNPFNMFLCCSGGSQTGQGHNVFLSTFRRVGNSWVSVQQWPRTTQAWVKMDISVRHVQNVSQVSLETGSRLKHCSPDSMDRWRENEQWVTFDPPVSPTLCTLCYLQVPINHSRVHTAASLCFASNLLHCKISALKTRKKQLNKQNIIFQQNWNFFTYQEFKNK